MPPFGHVLMPFFLFFFPSQDWSWDHPPTPHYTSSPAPRLDIARPCHTHQRLDTPSSHPSDTGHAPIRHWTRPHQTRDTPPSHPSDTGHAPITPIRHWTRPNETLDTPPSVTGHATPHTGRAPSETGHVPIRHWTRPHRATYTPPSDTGHAPITPILQCGPAPTIL